jgi:hypothetical protein
VLRKQHEGGGLFNKNTITEDELDRLVKIMEKAREEENDVHLS